MLEIFQYPFMQRALIAGVILAAILALLGIFVVLRKMSFFASGIAHASLAGVAIGILTSQNPLIVALILSVIFSIIIYLLENKYRIASDTTIGIIFTSGMALGVVLMSLHQGYQPELISFLFGNILSINNQEIWLILLLGFLIIFFISFCLRELTLLSLDKETAYITGVKVNRLQAILYITLSVSIVLGIKVLGIILISALLITPVATSKLLATSFKKMAILSVVLAEAAVLSGMFLSYYLDLPTGPTIVLVSTIIFILSLLAKAFKK